MPVRSIDHILIAMPAGGESRARAFYRDVLGLTEIPKPAQLAARGGCWFGNGAVTVHLGVERNFVPARKAHPAFIVDDLRDIIERADAGGFDVEDEDEPIAGCARRHVHDPFGNRIELIEPRR